MELINCMAESSIVSIVFLVFGKNEKKCMTMYSIFHGFYFYASIYCTAYGNIYTNCMIFSRDSRLWTSLVVCDTALAVLGQANNYRSLGLPRRERVPFPFYIFMLPQGKKVGNARCGCVFDVHTSKASKRLKVVLFHLWRVKVKTAGGFICISFGDFHIDKIAP